MIIWGLTWEQIKINSKSPIPWKEELGTLFSDPGSLNKRFGLLVTSKPLTRNFHVILTILLFNFLIQTSSHPDTEIWTLSRSELFCWLYHINDVVGMRRGFNIQFLHSHKEKAVGNLHDWQNNNYDGTNQSSSTHDWYSSSSEKHWSSLAPFPIDSVWDWHQSAIQCGQEIVPFYNLKNIATIHLKFECVDQDLELSVGLEILDNYPCIIFWFYPVS